MLVRRGTILMLEPRERLDFDLALIASGSNGLRSTLQWFALAPPRDGEIELTVDEAVLLGTLSPTQWTHFDDLARVHLLAKELIVAQGSDAATRDEQLRATYWRSASAVLHYGSRWRGIDTEAIQK